jgi:hypothetical protein
MFGDIDMQYIKNRGTTIGSKWRKAIDGVGFNIFDAIVIIINNMFIKQLVVVLDFITNVLKGFVGILYYNNNVDVNIQTNDGDIDISHPEHICVENFGIKRESENDTYDNKDGDNDITNNDMCQQTIDENILLFNMIDPTGNEDTNFSTLASHIESVTFSHSDQTDDKLDEKHDDKLDEKHDDKLDEKHDDKLDEKHDVKYTKIKIGKRNNKINVVKEQI